MTAEESLAERFPYGVPINRPPRVEPSIPGRPNWFQDVFGVARYREPVKEPPPETKLEGGPPW